MTQQAAPSENLTSVSASVPSVHGQHDLQQVTLQQGQHHLGLRDRRSGSCTR